jgi:phospholipase C
MAIHGNDDDGGKAAPSTATATGAITRRAFIRGAGAVGAAGLGASLLPPGRAISATKVRRHRRSAGSTPLRHVIIDCQENRSFDHYYGFAPFAGAYGVPPGYTQPDGHGGTVSPYEFTSLSTPDIGHSWTAVHDEVNAGQMDGFYTTDGIDCMGYYTGAELPYYYGLFEDFTLCANYFCSLLGPTWPNRFYLAAGTSGGITTNGVWGYGVLDYPIILDLLEDAGVTWKVYNIGWDSVPSFARGWDEHPPADVSIGMEIQRQLITALQRSSAWDTAAYILTYDEHGGYFEHVAPPSLDAYGAGVRVPTWVISPFAKKRHLEPTTYEHSSTLKFLETVFELPTLASVNHLFDTSTPGGPNNEAADGHETGPPAPPRDGRGDIGDLTECFTF